MAGATLASTISLVRASTRGELTEKRAVGAARLVAERDIFAHSGPECAQLSHLPGKQNQEVSRFGTLAPTGRSGD